MPDSSCPPNPGSMEPAERRPASIFVAGRRRVPRGIVRRDWIKGRPVSTRKWARAIPVTRSESYAPSLLPGTGRPRSRLLGAELTTPRFTCAGAARKESQAELVVDESVVEELASEDVLVDVLAVDELPVEELESAWPSQPPVGVVDEAAAKVPVSVVPTVTEVPATTLVGKPEGSDCRVPVGSLDSASVPSPELSVVIVPSTELPIETLSVLLAAAPLTLTVNVVTVTPSAVAVWYVAVPVSVPSVSVSAAVSVVPCETGLQPVLDVVAANVPVSDVPTVTAVPAATLVGKPVGSDCCVPVGSLDRASVPSPELSVVIVPTTVLPIETLSVLLAAAPLTLTENVVTVVPSTVVV